ncbi:MAG: hypothetical protein ACR2L9_11665 [Solirubrobacteraceae bacterium]
MILQSSQEAVPEPADLAAIKREHDEVIDAAVRAEGQPAEPASDRARAADPGTYD